MMLASHYGSILPALWSFMLAAARPRASAPPGRPSTCYREQEAAEVLGIPYDEVAQVALVPVAHTVGTEFKPGRREPLTDVVHWETW